MSVFPKGVPLSKRIFDLLLTVPGFLVLSPVLLLLAILVRIRMGAPVLFTQQRPGMGESRLPCSNSAR